MVSKVKVSKKRIEKNREFSAISVCASVNHCSLTAYKINSHKRPPTFINREFCRILCKTHAFLENLVFSICSLLGRVYAISGCHSLGKIKIQKNPAIKDWIAENKKMVGVRGFEPPTFASRTQRSNQAEPHPDKVAALQYFTHRFATCYLI